MSGQIVGFPCSVCGKRVVSVLDAKACGECGRPLHHRCSSNIEITSDGEERCSTCGSLRSAKSSYVTPEIASSDTVSLSGTRELIDPLMSLRSVLSKVVLAGFVIALARFPLSIFAIGTGNVPLAILLDVISVLSYAALAGFGPALLMLFMLPESPTNALYLRTFQADKESVRIRTLIQSGLGSKFRLSGIRDPARRRSIFDYLGIVAFIGRYSTPKYMNLESGGDWLERVATSIAKSRCVFIDVREMSPSVILEIRLAWTVAGQERVCFIIDGSQSEADWVSMIQQHLPTELSEAEVAEEGSKHSSAQSQITLAMWKNDREGQRLFQKVIGDFAAGLPAGVPGVDRLQSIPSKMIQLPDGDMLKSKPARMSNFPAVIGLAVVIGFVSTMLFAIPEWITTFQDESGSNLGIFDASTLAALRTTGQVAFWGASGLSTLLCIWAIIEYLIYCADNRRRFLLILCLSVILGILITIYAFRDV